MIAARTTELIALVVKYRLDVSIDTECGLAVAALILETP